MAAKKDARKERRKKERKRKRALRERARVKRSATLERGGAWKGRRAFKAHMEFERRAKKQSREADSLKEQASVAVAEGDWPRGLSLLQRALAVLPEGDRRAAASVIHQNLGHVCEHMPGIPQVVRLVQAELHYRAALDSAERQRDPLRYSQTCCAIASSLRQRALLVGDVTLLDEAGTLAAKAARVVERWGPLPPFWQFNPTTTQANLDMARFRLVGDSALLDSAEARFRLVLDSPLLAAWLDGEPDPQVIDVLKAASRSLAGCLHLAGRSREEQSELHRHVADVSRGREATLARIRWAEVLLDLETPSREDRDRAVQVLDGVEINWLRAEELLESAILLEQAGLTERARHYFVRAAQDGLEERRSARSDREADLLALGAQYAGLRSAVLSVAAAKPVEAFVGLEAVAAPRFEEALGRRWWLPTEDDEAAAHAAWLAIQGVCMVLTTVAETISPLEVMSMLSDDVDQAEVEAARQEIFDSAILPVEQSEMPDAAWTQHQLQSAFERASVAPSPSAYLRAEAERFADKSVLAERHLASVSESFAASRHPEGASVLDPLALAELVAAHPDELFLRFDSVEDTALAVSVWQEEDGTLGSLAARPDPAAIRGIAERLLAGTLPSEEELAAVRLDGAIPEDGPRRLVILAGRDAALLPIAALVINGQALLDRFDEIVSLPCLSPLRVPSQYYTGRDGSGTVAPTGTQLSAIAFAGESESNRLGPGSADSDGVSRLLQSCRSVAFYTHGEELKLVQDPRVEIDDAPQGGTLQMGLRLDDGVFPPEAFGAALAGLERVELWACRSGVNVPASLAPAGLAEAHGMDVSFLRGGARSALGTLWAVPELATAAIRAAWRRNLVRGLTPAAALVGAQRWWRDHFGNSGEVSAEAVSQRLNADFGIEVEARSSGGHLGPAGFPNEGGISDVTSWSGFRFMGRPSNSLDVGPRPDIRPSDVLRHIEEIEAVRRPPTSWDPDRLDRWFDEAIAAARLEFEAARAIGIGRDIADAAARHAHLRFHHPRDAHRLQVFHALAGLHQAEQDLLRTRAGRDVLDEVRARAALLWCEVDLERIESGPISLNTLHGPGALRAAALRDHLQKGSWWWILVHLAHSLVVSLPEAVSGRLGADQSGRHRPDHGQALMLATRAALELPPSADLQDERELQVWIARAARELAIKWENPVLLEPALGRVWLRDEVPRDYVEHQAEARLLVWTLELRNQLGEPEHATARDSMGIPFSVPPLERLIVIRQRSRLDNRRGAFADRGGLEWVSAALSAWESDLWGRFETQTTRSFLTRFGGGAGAAFLGAAGIWVGGLWHAGNLQRGVNETLTQLEFFVNRRVQFENRRNRMLGQMPEQGARPVAIASRYLDEANLVTAMVEVCFDDVAYQLEGNTPSMVPPTVDPFRESGLSILARAGDPEARIAWHLADALAEETLSRGDTAAWNASTRLVALGEVVGELGDGFDSHPDARGVIAKVAGADRTWNDLSAWVRRPQPGWALMGMHILPDGALTLAVSWCSRDGVRGCRGGRFQHLGMSVRLQLQMGSAAHIASEATERGLSFPIDAEDWLLSLQGALKPALDDALQPALEAGIDQIFVLSPLGLRCLPLAALVVGPEDRLLCEQVKSLAHVPTWEMLRSTARTQGPIRAVWAPDRGAAGAACKALEERLAKSGVHEMLPSGSDRDGTIRGLARLGFAVPLHDSEAPGIAATLGSLTLIGGRDNGPPRGVLCALDAEGFTIGSNRLARPFPVLRSAHIWAAPEVMRSPPDLELERVDRLPGFAPALLGSGAAGVLQEVYPLPDLPRSLLAEFVEVCGLAGMAGPAALRSAQHWYLEEVAPALCLKSPIARLQGVEQARDGLCRMVGRETRLPPLSLGLFIEPALGGMDPSDPRCFALVNWYGV